MFAGQKMLHSLHVCSWMWADTIMHLLSAFSGVITGNWKNV